MAVKENDTRILIRYCAYVFLPQIECIQSHMNVDKYTTYFVGRKYLFILTQSSINTTYASFFEKQHTFSIFTFHTRVSNIYLHRKMH